MRHIVYIGTARSAGATAGATAHCGCQVKDRSATHAQLMRGAKESIRTQPTPRGGGTACTCSGPPRVRQARRRAERAPGRGKASGRLLTGALAGEGPDNGLHAWGSAGGAGQPWPGRKAQGPRGGRQPIRRPGPLRPSLRRLASGASSVGCRIVVRAQGRRRPLSAAAAGRKFRDGAARVRTQALGLRPRAAHQRTRHQRRRRGGRGWLRCGSS